MRPHRAKKTLLFPASHYFYIHLHCLCFYSSQVEPDWLLLSSQSVFYTLGHILSSIILISSIWLPWLALRPTATTLLVRSWTVGRFHLFRASWWALSRLPGSSSSPKTCMSTLAPCGPVMTWPRVLTCFRPMGDSCETMQQSRATLRAGEHGY